MTEYETILTERIGRVLRITLNRPEQRNAMTYTLQLELIDAIEKAQFDDTRCIIIRGAGSSFCSGYALGGVPDKAAQADENYGPPKSIEEDVAMCTAIADRWSKIWSCRIPVIAQVHGYCVAGGTDVALNCDMVIMADDARIGFPPVRSQGGPPTHMWLYHAGPQWSKRILLTGDTITGVQAARCGLALESVPADELEEYVLNLATRISYISKDLTAHNKRIVNLGVELMGRGPMQVLGAIHDSMGHLAPDAAIFNDTIREHGARAAFSERDAPFKALDAELVKD